MHNRAEEYFKQFTELLGEHYKHERSVGFYARQLCITPKYLTTLIKRISGKSVSEWIDSYVILEAKTLLKYSNMSVQENRLLPEFPQPVVLRALTSAAMPACRRRSTRQSSKELNVKTGNPRRS